MVSGQDGIHISLQSGGIAAHRRNPCCKSDGHPPHLRLRSRRHNDYPHRSNALAYRILQRSVGSRDTFFGRAFPARGEGFPKRARQAAGRRLHRAGPLYAGRVALQDDALRKGRHLPDTHLHSDNHITQHLRFPVHARHREAGGYSHPARHGGRRAADTPCLRPGRMDDFAAGNGCGSSARRRPGAAAAAFRAHQDARQLRG